MSLIPCQGQLLVRLPFRLCNSFSYFRHCCSFSWRNWRFARLLRRPSPGHGVPLPVCGSPRLGQGVPHLRYHILEIVKKQEDNPSSWPGEPEPVPPHPRTWTEPHHSSPLLSPSPDPLSAATPLKHADLRSDCRSGWWLSFINVMYSPSEKVRPLTWAGVAQLYQYLWSDLSYWIRIEIRGIFWKFIFISKKALEISLGTGRQSSDAPSTSSTSHHWDS